MSRKLNIFYGAERVGTVHEDDNEQLSFEYSGDWLGNGKAFSLSLALELREGFFGHRLTKSFFENLLPESSVRKEFLHGLDDNDFNFLKKYGWECAGAFAIVEGEEYPTFLFPPRKPVEVSLQQIEGHLEESKKLTSTIIREHQGKFSLAGAQDKFAAIYRRKKILIPMDGGATTHIIKPPVSTTIHNSPYNEYFCMKLAKRVGLNVPKVDVIVGKFPLYWVERFDRERRDGVVERIHQQDFCQALGLTSHKKYQREGGPGLKDQYRIIKEHSNTPGRDVIQFFRWLWFNILIGNNDCHSKNLALLTTPSGLVLAPFYDLLSISIYPAYDNEFTYSIGDNWRWDKYKSKNFELLAQECHLSVEAIFKIGLEVFKKMSGHLEREVQSFEQKFPGEDVAKTIQREIEKRMGHLQERIPALKT